MSQFSLRRISHLMAAAAGNLCSDTYLTFFDILGQRLRFQADSRSPEDGLPRGRLPVRSESAFAWCRQSRQGISRGQSTGGGWTPAAGLAGCDGDWSAFHQGRMYLARFFRTAAPAY